jgi:DNA-binding SARP family transcriptional activator
MAAGLARLHLVEAASESVLAGSSFAVINGCPADDLRATWSGRDRTEATMRLRILGPLEVWDGAEWRRLGAPKWRSLLAALVIRSDRAVSVAELIEELWGDDPPGGAVNLVHGYVGRVRRVLDDRDGRCLRSRSPGYTLQLGPDDLDVQRFEDLAARGVAAQERNDPTEAARLLGDALAVWRGPAFADVHPTPLIVPEVERLEERRLRVVEARIEAELALGRHAELVSELQALVDDHPLREQLWHQLMLSLHRSRRQAEALDAYQRLYKLLDDELGLRPSRPLRDLQRQILTDQPEPGDASGRRAPSADVPRQLPAAPVDFTAREAEVRRLETIADLATGADTASAVVVSGAGGVGKTTLAVHWAHRAADRFPDGQLYLDLYGYSGRSPRSPEESLGRLLRGLGQPPDKIPSDLDDATALYRSLLAGRRVLVILDNARSVDQSTAAPAR